MINGVWCGNGCKAIGECFAECISEYETSKKPRRFAVAVHDKLEAYQETVKRGLDKNKEGGGIQSIVKKIETDYPEYVNYEIRTLARESQKERKPIEIDSDGRRKGTWENGKFFFDDLYI